MHTPGPWTAPVDGEGRIRGPNGEWLWHIEDYGNGVPDPERCGADARLIAAAPDLLEALELLIDQASTLPMEDRQFAAAAIAKARGIATAPPAEAEGASR